VARCQHGRLFQRNVRAAVPAWPPRLLAADPFVWRLCCSNLLYGIIAEFCTETACPVMCAGPKYEYMWADGQTIKKPISCSAPRYVDYLLTWVPATPPPPHCTAHTTSHTTARTTPRRAGAKFAGRRADIPDRNRAALPLGLHGAHPQHLQGKSPPPSPYHSPSPLPLALTPTPKAKPEHKPNHLTLEPNHLTLTLTLTSPSASSASTHTSTTATSSACQQGHAAPMAAPPMAAPQLAQRPSAAPVPPQGAPGRSGQLGTPRERPAYH
jgi:hypothetical protein